jgi:hypothetical protein
MPEDEAQIRSKVLLTGLDDRVCHPTTGTLVIAVLEESHRALSLPCMWSVGVMGTARSVIVCLPWRARSMAPEILQMPCCVLLTRSHDG